MRISLYKVKDTSTVAGVVELSTSVQVKLTGKPFSNLMLWTQPSLVGSMFTYDLLSLSYSKSEYSYSANNWPLPNSK